MPGLLNFLDQPDLILRKPEFMLVSCFKTTLVVFITIRTEHESRGYLHQGLACFHATHYSLHAISWVGISTNAMETAKVVPTLDEQQVEVNPQQGKLKSKLEREKKKSQQRMKQKAKMASKEERRIKNESKMIQRRATVKAKIMKYDTEEKKISEGFTWDPPGDSFWSFYAAARFWEIAWPRKSLLWDEPDADSSKTIIGSLLDLAARFFARAMKLENDNIRNL